jgi:hypothetical protein
VDGPGELLGLDRRAGNECVALSFALHSFGGWRPPGATRAFSRHSFPGFIRKHNSRVKCQPTMQLSQVTFWMAGGVASGGFEF